MNPTKLALISIGVLFSAVSGAWAATIYQDVPSGHWAESSILWASQEGLMLGPGTMPGRFDPAGSVNRAQLAVVMRRFYDRYSFKVQVLENRIAILENTVDYLQDQIESFGANDNPNYDFSATLTGGSEVPPVVTVAQGQGFFRVENNDLWYTLSVQGLSSAITGAHFHRGRATEAGPVIQDIVIRGTQATGVWSDLTEDQLTDLLSGRIYVNVHTERHPNGEVRGQVQLRSTSGTAASRSSRSSSMSSQSSSRSSVSSSVGSRSSVSSMSSASSVRSTSSASSVSSSSSSS